MTERKVNVCIFRPVNLLYQFCSFWLQRDEEIMLDVATCAMAFRILRMNGYDVSSGISLG
jgi:hypothetical protein